MTNRKNFIQKRSAFTMIELVLVIVVLGILASVAMPRLDRDLKQEAADNILSNIRYSQHLALTDFKHDFKEMKWHRTFWKMSIESCGSSTGLFTTVGSDMNYGKDIDKVEAAIDPTNGKPMFWTNTDSCEKGGDGTVSENIFITKKYGVQSVTGSNGCSGVQHIGFDHLGRPHVSFSGSNAPDYSTYMSTACTFTFTMSDNDTFAITIEPETGTAFIVGQDAS